ncbi:YARHG domain-containing protein [Butyribacter sp.]|uniref:YARHG domain-containing protein n=1 Tax=Butyribacter sp. TaxID=2822465 RepID=UPI002A9381D4|nr:YARHG domain-containing protein [Butyribacter sp.]
MSIINTIIVFIIFILSVIIAHMICSRYIYIGTFSGILTEKLTVWIITFMILAIAAMKLNILKLDDVSEDKKNKKVSERDINEYKKQIKDMENDVTSEESSEDLDYYDDSDLSEDDYDSDLDEDSDNYSDSSEENEYVLPDSAKRKLKKSDLKGLSKEELRIARNEIYARHGRMFDDKKLQKYFDSQSWYEGTVPASEFSEDVLSSVEKKNVAFIRQFE